ncbi:MAG TPA: hypothetical protein VF575_05410 [Candidatus Saccharimonadales bacterium]
MGNEYKQIPGENGETMKAVTHSWDGAPETDLGEFSMTRVADPEVVATVGTIEVVRHKFQLRPVVSEGSGDQNDTSAESLFNKR